MCMSLSRLRFSLKAAALHLVFSGFVAAISAGLVFFVWYPMPLFSLAGGGMLFFILVAVDVVAGPLLTLILFSPGKSKRELIGDASLIVLLQLSAFFYGFYSVIEARPVLLAFEGNRFVVVAKPDIDLSSLSRAAPEFQALSLVGPKLVGVRLSAPTDPDFPESIQLAIQGVPPAFRPERWVNYSSQKSEILASLRSLSVLRKYYPDLSQLIDAAVARVETPESKLGFLPLHCQLRSDWVVVLNVDSLQPVTYLPIDGWVSD